MTRDPDHFLNELPLWKLKAVAEAYAVDVSACRYKRDYVQRIAAKNITEAQVRQVLARLGKERDSEVEDVKKEVERIATTPVSALELPEDDIKEVERHLDEALAMRPSMFEVDSLNEAAYGRMLLGDFYQAIKLNRDARTKCLDGLSRFQVYSAAVSIRAADELFSRIASQKGDLDPVLKTALAEAKRAFISGPPKRREDALDHLETLATKAFDAYLANTEKDEAELRALLADYESFGTRTEEPRRFLDVAAEAKRAMNIAEYEQLLRSARDSAERAKDLRTKEISASFNIVRAGIAEAKELGILTAEAESGFQEAEKAFGGGSFREAVALLSSIERQVDDAHLAKLRAERSVENQRLEQARAQLDRLGPVLNEATSYGFATQEGHALMANARAALAAKDAVNASKYTRLVGEVVSHLLKDVIAKRIELGVAKKMEGARCGRCGKETLYMHPDAIQRCSECGHSFTMEQTSPEAAVEPSPQQEAAPQAETTTAPVKQKRKRRLVKW